MNNNKNRWNILHQIMCLHFIYTLALQHWAADLTALKTKVCNDDDDDDDDDDDND